jgi:predicted lipid-binding transport protein (Tim44 family)
MKKTGRFLLCLFIALTLALGLVGEASAKRLGGGKSFGSRPSYSEPYRAPSNASPGFQSQNPAYRSPASERNQAARDAMGRRGGFMGMLGGLALGGLLGAMLFGGAFEHINLFDILIFAGIAFLLFKLLATRRGTVPEGRYGTAAGPAQVPVEPAGYEPGYQRRADSARPATSPAGFDTDILSRKGGLGSGSGAAAAPAVPSDFDANAFLSGARAAYAQMQQAWDQGDVADLRALTTDKVFAELQDQLRERSGENRTELLNVDARLLEVRDEGSERRASVLFDVLMREAPGEEPQQVREVWHFVRPQHSRQPTWFLDGIQQLGQ